MHTGGVRATQAGPEVMGVGNTVQNQQQRIFGQALQRFSQIIFIPGFERPDGSYRSLVIDIARQLGERVSRDDVYVHAGGLGILFQFLRARILARLRQPEFQ